MHAQAAQPVFTVQELAVRWQVSERVVQKWIGERHFPNAYKVGPGKSSHWRIPAQDVTEFEENRRKVF